MDKAIGREGYACIDDYVILKAEVYDRIRAVVDDGLDMTQVGALVEAAMSRRGRRRPIAGELPELSAMIRRGDVVVVDFPFTDLRASKVRPALVVQNDLDNARRRKTIIVLITGNLRRGGDPSQLLIDPATQGGASSGLHGPSLVACNNLFTIEQSGILRTIGMLPASTMVKIDACLKVALGLP